MKLSDAFPSKYLKATDLQGRPAKVVIASVEYEDVGDGEKLVAYFRGKEKGIVLNRTNCETIAEVYGDETDEWIGKAIVLFKDRTRFQGKMVDCIRIRFPEEADAAPPPAARAPAPARRTAPPAESENPGDALDDEIPF